MIVKSVKASSDIVSNGSNLTTNEQIVQLKHQLDREHSELLVYKLQTKAKIRSLQAKIEATQTVMGSELADLNVQADSAVEWSREIGRLMAEEAEQTLRRQAQLSALSSNFTKLSG